MTRHQNASHEQDYSFLDPPYHPGPDIRNGVWEPEPDPDDLLHPDIWPIEKPLPYYGTSWQKQRKKALERDNYQCQECLSTEGLEVHHVLPFRFFVRSRVANRLHNLLTLCRDCHQKIHSNGR